MDLNQLDQALRTLTPSEKRYKYHHEHCDYSGFPSIERNGEKVYLMNHSNFRSFSVSAVDPRIALKKQSRYDSCPPHIHDWVEFVYVYSGSSVQHINGTTLTLHEHQVLLIDTNTPHSCDAPNDDDISVSLIIYKEYLNNNFFNRLSKDSILSRFLINAINNEARHQNYILFHSEDSRQLSLYFNELIGEVYFPSANCSDIVDSLIILIICTLLEIPRSGIADSQKKNNSVSQILQYIEEHYSSCSLESTAAFFSMNPNYLSTLLKQRTGYSYKELVQYQRLTRAALLLRSTTVSTAEIANAVGYENISFFYRKFKEQFSCTPKVYRDMHQTA